MYLDELKCQAFRCLADIRFEPSRNINLIRGKNAHGKTSLLEAILFAATSKSHRTTVEADLAAHGEEGFRIALHVMRADREVALEVNWWQGDKRVKVNGVPQSRMSDTLGKVRVVLFSPEDIALVKGSASTRRKFLDMELSQLSPAYLNALQHYRQVLRQRNELLRAQQPDSAQLDAWDEQLIRYGRILIRERASFTEELGEFSARAYNAIAHEEKLTLHYRPDIPEDGLEKALQDSRASDMRRKQTSHGPHRDEIDFIIDGKPARSHASQGQQKSAALAVKLAELELVRQRTDEYPILMLDEVLAELDAGRANRLFDAIDEEVQCILTTTELCHTRNVPTRGATIFMMENGNLSRL